MAEVLDPLLLLRHEELLPAARVPVKVVQAHALEQEEVEVLHRLVSQPAMTVDPRAELHR